MRRAILLSALLILAHGVAPVGAGRAEPASAGPQQPVPVFRTGVELVRVDVRITDDDGRPIRDLRAEEVEIVESGETRPVLLFQHIEQPVGSYADVARRTIASEVSTNQGSPRGHVYVLVFDQLHITLANEQRARRAAERFLKTRVRPGDRVALYALPGPGPQIEFTGDTGRVIRALPWVRGSREDAMVAAVGTMRVSDAYEVTRGNQEVLGRYMDRSQTDATTTDSVSTTNRGGGGRPAEDPAVLRRQILEDARIVTGRADGESRRFLQQLEDVVRTLRDVEGRKSLVLFSEGFEIDNVRPEIEQIAAAAAQSYSVIYALDLNPRFQGLDEMQPRGSSAATEILSRLESLGSLAAETEGILYNDASPQADRILNQISEASQDYYLVGFAPSDAAMRDRTSYRRIKVRVTRPGVRVSARSGYALGSAATPADRRRSIEAAMRAPFSQQGLRVEYTTYVLGGIGPDTQRVIMSLAAGLPVAEGAAPPAEVVFVVRDVRSGRLAANGSDTIPLPESARPGATAGTGLYRVQFELPPGIYLMRTVVREPGGLLGSADRRFQVRALGGPSLAAGDLILSSAGMNGLPVRTTVYTGEVISGVLELYGRTPEQLDAPIVTADLLAIGSTAPVTSGRASLGAVKTGPSGSSRGASVDIPLQGIDPGEYVVRATVRKGRETAAVLYRDVTIAAGTRPAAPPGPATPNVVESLDPNAVLQGDIGRRFTAQLLDRTAAGTDDPAVAAARVGLARFEAHEYAAAATAWTACLDADPKNATVAFLLGWANAAAGDDRAAVSSWRVAIVADPGLVPAYLALIDAYLRLGQPDLALTVARGGQEAIPSSVELRDRVQRLEKW